MIDTEGGGRSRAMSGNEKKKKNVVSLCLPRFDITSLVTFLALKHCISNFGIFSV